MKPIDPKMNTTGREIMQEIGVLTERTEALEDMENGCEADPEEVGSWITAIGKALLAVFKP